MTEPNDATIARMYDAIEHTRWQDLADALNRLTEWGADPLLALADQLGTNQIVVLDPAEDHHTYRLRHRPPFGEERERDGGPGWIVERRPRPGQRYRCASGHLLPAGFTPSGDPDTWDDTCRCRPA